MTSRHEHPGKMPLRNLTVDGCAWAACGKSLASKQIALGTRGSSVKKRAWSTTTRFPTGCAGPWKTLVSIRWCRSYEMREQKRVPRISTASFPPPLYRGQGARRLLLVVLFFCQSSEQEVLIDYPISDFKQVYFGSYRYPIGRLLRRSGRREVTFRHGRF